MTKAKELLKMANNEAYGDKRDFKKIDIYYEEKMLNGINLEPMGFCNMDLVHQAMLPYFSSLFFNNYN